MIQKQALQEMERSFDFITTDEPIELPPGFRFHPTDEELITHYLSPKALDSNFTTSVIGEVNLNNVEPWDLPWNAKIGEKEWYFFYMRDRKYPNGLRMNRATDAGYWKATGKDKEIYRAKILVGMKKTLVFYKGRAPRGEKSNWVMHEFRLQEKNSMHSNFKSDKNAWVICRIFNKSPGEEKLHITGPSRGITCSSNMPPSIAEGSRATSFSNPMENRPDKPVDEFCPSTKNSDLPFNFSQFPDHDIGIKSCMDGQDFPIISDFDGLWDY